MFSNPRNEQTTSELLIRLTLTVACCDYCDFLDVLNSKTEGVYNFNIIRDYPEAVFKCIQSIGCQGSFEFVQNMYNSVTNGTYDSVINIIHKLSSPE
jgi:hypothetical protein